MILKFSRWKKFKDNSRFWSHSESKLIIKYQQNRETHDFFEIQTIDQFYNIGLTNFKINESAENNFWWLNSFTEQFFLSYKNKSLLEVSVIRISFSNVSWEDINASHFSLWKVKVKRKENKFWSEGRRKLRREQSEGEKGRTIYHSWKRGMREKGRRCGNNCWCKSADDNGIYSQRIGCWVPNKRRKKGWG